MYKGKKVSMILFAGMFVFLSSCAGPQAVSQKCNLTKDAYDGWHLGVMAWTFNRYTFYEAIDKTAAMGMHYIQGSLNQQISKEKPDVKFSYRMHPEIREEIKQKLTQSKVSSRLSMNTIGQALCRRYARASSTIIKWQKSCRRRPI